MSTLRLSDRQLAARATAAAAASLADLQLGTSAPEVRIYTAPRPASVAAGYRAPNPEALPRHDAQDRPAEGLHPSRW